MNQTCIHHPSVPAQWHCTKCNSTYCPDCISKRDKGGYTAGEYLYMCPKCNMEANWMGVSHIIKPFWVRLPKIFIYPAHYRALILILVITVIGMIFSGGGLFSASIRFILGCIIIKYSYEALLATARGTLVPPPINSQTLSDNFGIVFKQVILIIILGALTVLLFFKVGWLVALIFLLVDALFFPSLIILMIAPNSIIFVLNPAMFIRMAGRIGGGYLLMYFFLLLFLGAPTALVLTIIKFVPNLPEIIALFFYVFADKYYTIMFYHFMGYVLLQYHQEIGYEIEMDDFQDPDMEKKEAATAAVTGAAALLRSLTLMIQEGKYHEAIALIESETRQEGIQDYELSERYLNLLKMTKQGSKMLKHCVTHLDIMARENKKGNALAIYSQCFKANRNFMPTARTLFKLGEWFNESGKSKASVATFNRLIKNHSSDPLVPMAYFRVAQVFNDRFMNTEKAKAVLKALIRKYPDHEIIPKTKNYLTHMGG